jgi:hypothetical protein
MSFLCVKCGYCKLKLNKICNSVYNNVCAKLLHFVASFKSLCKKKYYFVFYFRIGRVWSIGYPNSRFLLQMSTMGSCTVLINLTSSFFVSRLWTNISWVLYFSNLYCSLGTNILWASHFGPNIQGTSSQGNINLRTSSLKANSSEVSTLWVSSSGTISLGANSLRVDTLGTRP